MATIALQDEKVVLKDGKASCSCCSVVDCGTIPESPFGIVLSEEQYNNFAQGGNYTINAAMSENFTGAGSCSSNLNGSGSLPSCIFQISVREFKCNGLDTFYDYASFSVTVYFGKEAGTGIYKMHYSGQAQCPYPFFGFCYSVGYYINETYDGNPPSIFAKIGTVTMIIKGTTFHFGVWSFPPASGFNSSASATINIT
jgi:hypothetical protein